MEAQGYHQLPGEARYTRTMGLNTWPAAAIRNKQTRGSHARVAIPDVALGGRVRGTVWDTI